jgi:hypothetical protein
VALGEGVGRAQTRLQGIALGVRQGTYIQRWLHPSARHIIHLGTEVVVCLESFEVVDAVDPGTHARWGQAPDSVPQMPCVVALLGQAGFESREA